MIWMLDNCKHFFTLSSNCLISKFSKLFKWVEENKFVCFRWPCLCDLLYSKTAFYLYILCFAEHRDKKGFTPLILAATAGHEKVVEILMNHTADMEAQSERTKDTPLSLACSGGRYEVFIILFKGTCGYFIFYFTHVCNFSTLPVISKKLFI